MSTQDKIGIKFILIAVFIIFLAIILFLFGQDISMADQKKIYDKLGNTAALLFAIMGAWLAILHPHILSSVYDKNRDFEGDRQTIKMMFDPVFYSFLIIVFSILVVFLEPIFKSIDFFIEYKRMIRGLSFSLVSALTLLLIYSATLTLIPVVTIKRNMDNNNSSKERRSLFFNRDDKDS